MTRPSDRGAIKVTPIISQPTPVSKNPAYLLWSATLEIPEPVGHFSSQCTIIFKLQPSSFHSDRSRIAYIITLMLGRVLAWTTSAWEQQSAVCLSLEDFVEEVRKVFDSPLSGREAAR
jgi:hypothetical protein